MAMASMAAIPTFGAFSLIPSSKSPKIKSPRFQSFAPLNFRQLQKSRREFNAVKASATGLYSADQFALTVENVDKVLDNVRPYLIADGGDVDVVSVENGVVSLKLKGKLVFPRASSPISLNFIYMKSFFSGKKEFNWKLLKIVKAPSMNTAAYADFEY